MVEYDISENNLHIADSCLVPKKRFRRELVRIEGRNPDSLVWKRSKCSMMLEWAVHNALYDIGYAKERTKDVDLNYPQKLWEKVVYPILGCLFWPFID